MPNANDGPPRDRPWSFWTSALWTLEVATPSARSSSSRFLGPNGRPTLVARKLAEELERLALAAGEPDNEIFVADRTTFFHALLWWIDARDLLPSTLARPIVPSSAMLWFGSALRERFGSAAAIHGALLAIAGERAVWRDAVLTEKDLRESLVARLLNARTC